MRISAVGRRLRRGVLAGVVETDASFAPFSYLKPLAGNFSNNNHTVVGYAAF
jgi:hypothetical protein